MAVAPEIFIKLDNIPFTASHYLPKPSPYHAEN